MTQIPNWADHEAWEALHLARRRVAHTDPSSGKTQWIPEWQHRQAPSVGARARAILNTLMYPPSYIRTCEEALGLYLSVLQNADRRGFYVPRRVGTPQVRSGVQNYG